MADGRVLSQLRGRSRSSPSAASASLWRLPGLRALTALCVLGFASFFLTLSSLPLYSISVGAAPGTAGLVTAAMLVTTVITQTLVPAMVRRLGLLPVLGAGLGLLGAPAVLYLLGRQFWAVLSISAVRGVGFAVLTVLTPLVASRLVPAVRRGEAIGVYGLAIAVPNLLLVPLGVALTAAGHFAVVAVLAVAPLLALPLLRPLARSLLPGEPDSANPSSAEPDGSLSEPAIPQRTALRAVLGTVLVLLTVTLAGGGVLTFLPVVRPSGSLATIALLTLGATGALARWRAGKLSDRIGNRILLPAAVSIAAAGMVLLSLGLALPFSAMVVLGAAVLGVGYGSVQNLSLLVVFDRAGPAHQTMASAAWNAAFDAGTSVGALAVGLVATGGPRGGPGFSWTFAGCAVLIAVALPIAVRAARPAER